MARRGFGVGMIALLIVVAVVLTLAAKAWKSVAPEVLEINGAAQIGPLDTHGQDEAAGELRSGQLPRLSDTRRETDEHSARVQEALNAVE
jgi:hypothetical protein